MTVAIPEELLRRLQETRRAFKELNKIILDWYAHRARAGDQTQAWSHPLWKAYVEASAAWDAAVNEFDAYLEKT